MGRLACEIAKFHSAREALDVQDLEAAINLGGLMEAIDNRAAHIP